jgi:hypothetical protein
VLDDGSTIQIAGEHEDASDQNCLHLLGFRDSRLQIVPGSHGSTFGAANAGAPTRWHFWRVTIRPSAGVTYQLLHPLANPWSESALAVRKTEDILNLSSRAIGPGSCPITTKAYELRCL